MAERRCPGCGYLMKKESQCPICLTRVPGIADPRPKQTWQPPRRGSSPQKKARSSRLLLALLTPVLILILITGIIFSTAMEYGTIEEEPFSYIDDLEDSRQALAELDMDYWEENLPVIEPTVLYDQDGITLTATEILPSYGDLEVRVTLTNHSGQAVTISSEGLSVNGYAMSASGIYCSASPGETVEDYFFLYQEDLERADITTIAQIQFRLQIRDPNTYDELAMSDVLTLKTDAPEDFVQSVDDSGMEIYNADGIRVVFREMTLDEDSDGVAYFYVENATDQVMTVCSTLLSVNGSEAMGSIWLELLPNSRGVEGMVCYDLDSLGIDDAGDLEELSLTICVDDGASWENMVITDPITIDLTMQ